MIQQQKAGRSLPAEFRHIAATHGPLKVFKGLSATILRESLYASGYLAVAPMLREVLAEQPALAGVPGGPLVVSGIAAGLLATVCTQPADTIKTRMQVGRGRGTAFAPASCVGLICSAWLLLVICCLLKTGGLSLSHSLPVLLPVPSHPPYPIPAGLP